MDKQKSITPETIPTKTKIAAWIMGVMGGMVILFPVLIREFYWLMIVIHLVIGGLFIFFSQLMVRKRRWRWIVAVLFYFLLLFFLVLYLPGAGGRFPVFGLVNLFKVSCAIVGPLPLILLMLEKTSEEEVSRIKSIILRILIIVPLFLSGILAVFLLTPRYPPRRGDVRIITGISQVRSIATLVRGDKGSYAELCESAHSFDADNSSGYGADLQTLQNDIASRQGGSLALYCYTVYPDVYCVSAQLRYDAAPTGAGNEDYYCVDSTGIATTTTSGNYCDPVNATCAND